MGDVRYDRAPTVLAADIGGTKVAAAVATPRGEVLFRDRLAIRVDGTVATPREVVNWLGAFVRRSGGPRPRATAVSIAAGLDARQRSLTFAPNLPEWEGADLAGMVEDVVGGGPAELVYDGHSSLFGECAYGAARGHQNVVMLVLGTGVGGAILSEGRLLKGADGLAGVAGYMPVSSGGRLVALEDAVSGPALARRASSVLGRQVDAAGLLRMAGEGVPSAARLMDEAVAELSTAIAALTSVLNPEVVLLGGGLGEALAPYTSAMQQHVRAWAQPIAGRRVRIVPGQLGRDACLLGAVHTAAKGLLAD